MSASPTPATPEPGGLLRTLIGRPVTVIVGSILVVLFGAISLLGLPIQVTPDVTIPTLTVFTRWPGAAPTEIEAEILEKQEEALKSLEGLVKMVSLARPDEGEVQLELEVGTNIDEALVRVTNALSQVPSYPAAADEPVVTTSSNAGPPLAVITITARDGSSPEAYRTWVQQKVVPQIERIRGVSEAFQIGGRDTEVQVLFDARALAARGLTIPRVAARVSDELRDVSAGDLRVGKRELLVRTPVAPDEPRELERLVLGAGADGTPILLGDVATVRLALREPSGMAMSDDKPSLVLLLRREAGTNVLEVTRKIRARVAELQRDLLAPENLSIQIVSDQVDYITGALDRVGQNLLMGAGFAVVTLLLFLRSIGASLIISLAIPLCVFGTALGMTLFGRTINVVSLAGITFAIGMVLDNSIVSLESIDTWRDRAPTRLAAAYAGVREVWGALLASTLTTAAVFVPIINWEGEVGQLLRDVAVAVAVSVSLSLLVSVLVIPSLAGRFLRVRGERPERGTTRQRTKRLVRVGEHVRERIGTSVAWLIASPRRALALSLLAVAGAALAAILLLPPLEYLPTGSRNLVFGIIVPPPGYAVEELQQIGRQTQTQLARHTGVRRDGVPPLRRSFFVGTPERLFSGAVAEDPEEIRGVLTFLRRVQAQIPGVFAFTTQASLFGNTIGGTRSIELEIAGANLSRATELGGRIFGRLRQVLPGAQIRPIPSLDPGAPELRVIPRRDDVAALELTAAQLGQVASALIDGAIVGEWGREGEPKVDVVLRAVDARGEPLTSASALAAAPVATPSGNIVPLAALATLREELGPTVIQRVERSRALTLQISPPESMALERGIELIESEVLGPLRAANSIPPDLELRLSGTASKLDQAKERFFWVLVLAVVILFLMMAAVFEDFLAPLAVLVSVPLAAAGGIIGLRLVDFFTLGEPLNLMTAVGFVILIGVVVNNAILVVDGAVARLREGLALEQAVPEAVRARIRPIFMTTATSLAGLAPMVVFSGFGSELYRGIGAIVLSGLALGTLMTLYVVPAVFSLLWTLRLR